MTSRTKEMANSGSMPLLVPAMTLMVPVGAIVVTVALRIAVRPRCCQRLPSKLGKEPRRPAISADFATARSSMNFMISSATGQRRFGIVADAQPHQRLGKAHDAQADLAVAVGHLLDLRQREAIGVDDVVQKVHRDIDQFAEPLPVDFAAAGRRRCQLPARLARIWRAAHQLRKVDRAQVA